MKLDFKNPALVLGLAYLIGQGSSLLLIIILRKTIDEESVGLAVLLIGCFSMAFQFLDFGNSTYGIKMLSQNKHNEYANFRVGRSVISIPFIFGVCWLMLSDKINGVGVFIIGVEIAIIGFLLSLINTVKYEVSGYYLGILRIQLIIWGSTVLLIYLSYAMQGLSSIYVGAFILVICSLLLVSEINRCRIKIKFEVKYLILPLTIIIPAMFGQIGARWMMVIVANVYSLAELGPLAIAKSIHTASCVAFGILIRPIIRNYLVEKLDLTMYKLAIYILNNIKYKILMIGVLQLICIAFFDVYDNEIAGWLLILIGAPFWMLNILQNQLNQIKLRNSEHVALIDLISMAMYLIGFLALIKYDLIFAFVIADVTKFLGGLMLTKIYAAKIKD